MSAMDALCQFINDLNIVRLATKICAVLTAKVISHLSLMSLFDPLMLSELSSSTRGMDSIVVRTLAPTFLVPPPELRQCCM